MLINSLSLKNFKCFEELDVKFAPITLLTGANSSGKSSLINAILAVLQTEQFPFYLSPNGQYVNMGSFEEMVKGKTTNNLIEVKLKCRTHTIPAYFETRWQLNSQTGLPELESCKFWILDDWEISIIKDKDKINLSITIEDRQVHTLIRDIDWDWEFVRNLKPGITIKSSPRKEHWAPVDEHVKTSSIQFSSIDEAVSWIHLSPLAIRDMLEYWNEEMNRNFNYIGSFRLPPERTYYQKAKASSKVSSSGEGYIDQIIEWQDTNSDNFAELNQLLQNLELFEELQSSRLKGGRFDLNIKTKSSSTFASLADVGFGISQFLPIIVADLQLSDNSCLAISQPEIHLHPKIQAQFGNYLADQIKRTKKQYIVETHSEYLLNRIRLLLVTGELKPEDVCVLYFENDGIKSTVHNVEFATDGQIKGAPQGFFDTYGIDVMNIAMNAIG